MLICTECGNPFNEEDAVIVYDDPSPAGVGLPSGAYKIPLCPFCRSEYIEEAARCASCGNYFDGDEILCDDCRAELAETMNKIRLDMKLTKDDFEQVIVEHFGW